MEPWKKNRAFVLVCQPVPTRKVAFLPSLRPADSEQSAFSSILSANADSTDSPFPATLNLDNFESPERRSQEREKGSDAHTWQAWLQKGEETQHLVEEPPTIDL